MKAFNVFYPRVAHMTNVLQLENNEIKGLKSFLLLGLCILFSIIFKTNILVLIIDLMYIGSFWIEII